MAVLKSKRPYSYTDQKTRQRKTFFLLRVFIVMFLVYSAITWLFLVPVSAASDAMKPGVREGDSILVSPIVFGPANPLAPFSLPGFSNPGQGDLVLVDPPWHSVPGFFPGALDALVRFATFQRIGFVDDRDAHWEHAPVLKRIIGLPGDTVYMKDFIFYVKKAGTTYFLTEFEVSKTPYELSREKLPDGYAASMPFSGSLSELTLKADQYFVAGDNRTLSGDSRYWGPVGRASIRGRAFMRYWPFGRFSLL